jgi:quinol---cytochrome c reductase cytochrome c subunit, bacillus type
MRLAALLACVLAALLVGCGSSSTRDATSTRPQVIEVTSGPAEIPISPPPAVKRAGDGELAQFELGQTVAAQSGCLACHRIGDVGNSGPGADLTHVGSKLALPRIERTMLSPTPPMPSFRHLPEAKLGALVRFLSLLQ